MVKNRFEIPLSIFSSIIILILIFSGTTTRANGFFNLGFQWQNHEGNAWMAGSSNLSENGVYGTKGNAAPSNHPGGRHHSAGWIDQNGEFWLFGGHGEDSSSTNMFLNDLWKYNPQTGLWTWMSGPNTGNGIGDYGTKGTSSSTNIPSARYGATYWFDSSGELWLFGGDAIVNPPPTAASSSKSDLWKFSLSTLQWTWVGGPNTYSDNAVGTKGTSSTIFIPAARSSSVGWKDQSGNFWIFGGGRRTLTTYFNDLWKFDPTNGAWTWQTGSSSSGGSAFYGTKGQSGSSNTPGARASSMSWTDSDGRLWLFGGCSNGPLNFGHCGSGFYWNDVWLYDQINNQWTWIAGSSSSDAAANYGTKGIESSLSTPGARAGAITWADGKGNLWLYGGGNASGFYRDLWKFNTKTSKWVWISGDQGAIITTSTPTFDILNVRKDSYSLAARAFGASWVDKSGSLWLFGGWNPAGGKWADLWRLIWH